MMAEGIIDYGSNLIRLQSNEEIFGTNPSPEGRGWPEGPGEGCRKESLHPSPGASHHPLPSGEGSQAPRRFRLPLAFAASAAHLVGRPSSLSRAPPISSTRFVRL